MPSGSKPLPESVLIKFDDAIGHKAPQSHTEWTLQRDPNRQTQTAYDKNTKQRNMNPVPQSSSSRLSCSTLLSNWTDQKRNLLENTNYNIVHTILRFHLVFKHALVHQHYKINHTMSKRYSLPRGKVWYTGLIKSNRPLYVSVSHKHGIRLSDLKFLRCIAHVINVLLTEF